MSTVVKCECCGVEGHRPLGYRAPEGWFYLESSDSEGGMLSSTLIIYVCSYSCSETVWERGPGPRWTAEEMGVNPEDSSGVDRS